MHHIAEFSRSGSSGRHTGRKTWRGTARVVVDRMGEFLMDICAPSKAAGNLARILREDSSRTLRAEPGFVTCRPE